MTDREAKEQITKHAERLRLNGSIKKEMAQIARKQGRAAAEEHLRRLATTDFFKGNP